MVQKVEIRRVVYCTCVVAPPGEGSSAAAGPSQVTVSVRRPRGCWGMMGRSWKELAVFSFKDRPKPPYFTNAFLDLERVYKYSRKADTCASQVKIRVSLRSGATRVARVNLDDFMGQLLQSGRPEWVFLHVYEGMVTLMQANMPVSNAPPEWAFDGMARDTHQGPKGEKNIASDGSKVTQPEKSQENVTTDQGAEDNDYSPDNAGKAEDVFPTEDKESDVAEDEKESQEESAEDITLDTDEGAGGEGGSEADDEDSDGLTEQDTDGSGWESLEDDIDEGPEKGLGGGPSVLARLGAAWRHHRRGLLLFGVSFLVWDILNYGQPPNDLANWLWGGAGGEL